jgi:hypothetical protein
MAIHRLLDLMGQDRNAAQPRYFPTHSMEVEMSTKRFTQQTENLMNKNLPLLSIFTAFTLFIAAYVALILQAQSASAAASKPAAYEAILGKSLGDKAVDDFIVSNNCSSKGQFQLCNDAGVALWIGQDQNVETVYLYPNQIHDFGAYKGTLPLGLSRNDTMASVENKFGQPRVGLAPQAGWLPGLADENGTPDHIHAWAIYKRFGLTVVYNSPSVSDKGATIYAILISK